MGKRRRGACARKPSIARSNSTSVRAGIARWCTSGSASYARTTAGSRLTADGGRRNRPVFGATVDSTPATSLRKGATGSSTPSAGADSTSPRNEPCNRSALANATAPPMLCPSRKTGAPGCCRDARPANAQKSDTRWSNRSMFARGPGERPCPRWSTAYTAWECATRSSASLAYRPECSPNPCATAITARASPSGSQACACRSSPPMPVLVNSRCLMWPSLCRRRPAVRARRPLRPIPARSDRPAAVPAAAGSRESAGRARA